MKLKLEIIELVKAEPQILEIHQYRDQIKSEYLDIANEVLQRKIELAFMEIKQNKQINTSNLVRYQKNSTLFIRSFPN